MCYQHSSRDPFDAYTAYLQLASKQQELYRLFLHISNTASANDSSAFKQWHPDKIGIIGGDATDSYLECCLVGYQLPGGLFKWHCSGVLVDDRTVITAAH